MAIDELELLSQQAKIANSDMDDDNANADNNEGDDDDVDDDDEDEQMSSSEENDNNAEAGSVHSDTTYDGIADDDDDDNAEDDDDDVSGTPDTLANPGGSGMADVIAKLLKKSIPQGKTPILCKATTERELAERKRNRKRKEPGEVEVVQVKGESGTSPGDLRVPSGSDSEDNDDDGDDDVEAKIKKLKAETYSEQLKKKRAWEEMGRVKPQPLDRDLERSLQRIATKGVVQLFNAVKKQQTIDEEKTGKSNPVSAKAKCGNFLDMLQAKSNKKQKEEEIKEEIKEEEEENGTWSVLRDDFMLGSAMKDWDKEMDS